MFGKRLFAFGAIALAACLSYDVKAESKAVAAAVQVEDAFAEVVEHAKSAVVVITNKQTGAQNMPMQMNGMPEEFFQFFNIPRNQMPRQSQSPQNSLPVVVGRGSGVLVRDNGYILTNYHVIQECDYLEVRTSDGTVYDNYEDENAVSVVGYDKETDLAVLQIAGGSKKDFKSLAFADSDKLRVGQWAIAIGAPFDLDYSVTIGCVSQKGRTDLGMSTFDSYIQTDASINPGNSGGPLLNIHGDIIGINQFIVTGGNGSKGSVGIGFAIASNLSKKVADELIENGQVSRPFIGVTMQELSKAMKENMELDHGVLIREVIAGEAAEKAGLKPGDVILSVDGTAVRTSHELLMAINRFRPGDEIPLEVRRGDETLKMKIKAGYREKYIGQNDISRSGKAGKNGSKAEASLRKLGLNLLENNGKVIVQEVIPGGAAEMASISNDDKIMPGDALIEINRNPVASIADVKDAMSKLKKNTVILYMERKNQRGGEAYKYFIAVNLGE